MELPPASPPRHDCPDAAEDPADHRVRALARRIEALEGDMDALLYAVSHDLRAPLRTIAGFTDLVLEDASEGQPLGADAIDNLRRVRAGANRLSAQIEAILSLSRLAQSDPHRQAVDLSAMATRITDELRQSDPGREAVIAVEPGLEARADERLVQVVLQVLLDNAWKYTRRAPRAEISVGLETADGIRVFVVRDNGAGFPAAQVSRLFRPFSRLHAERDFEGLGIGLALAKRAAGLLGGRLWAESAEGAGATFRFTLEPPAGSAGE